MTLTYVSLFSGIEAFSVAASRIADVDWRPVFFSEIDPFASAVLADHFPDVTNLGDITQIQIDPETNTARNHDTTIPLPRTGIDLLAGGSPCQDVSVAGKRAGMQEGSGTRSSLAFEYARLVRALRPRVLLWENVPGVLSSNGGRDFGAFLRSLAELGYGLAWRVLDVQHARVDSFPGATPQRRRRVWLVGCLGGDGRIPAEILFEPARLLGDTPPRREAGKGFAAPAGYGPPRNGRMVEGARRTYTIGGGGRSDVSEVLTARSFKGIGARNGQISGPFVATTSPAPSAPPTEKGRTDRTSASSSASASFDGNDVSATLHKPNGSPGFSDQEIFSQGGAYLARAAFENHAQDSRVREIDVSDTRSRKDGTGGNNLPLVVYSKASHAVAGCLAVAVEGNGQRPSHMGSGYNVEGASFTLNHVEQHAVAVRIANTGSLGAQPEQSPTIPRDPGGVSETLGVDGFNQTPTGDVSKTLVSGASDYHHVPLGALRYIVRRLTPGECETLQAFPQGWTRIPYRGKPADQCPDSPRYKALGNSWGTNCAEWVLRRIVAAFRLGLIPEAAECESARNAAKIAKAMNDKEKTEAANE